MLSILLSDDEITYLTDLIQENLDACEQSELDGNPKKAAQLDMASMLLAKIARS